METPTSKSCRARKSAHSPSACRVGLDGVADDLSGAAEAGLQQHGPFEELHAEQCRLAPVPDELNDPVFLVAQDPCDRVRQNLE